MKIFTIDAPLVPIAQADGLIMTNDLSSDVLIYFPVWNNAMIGDTYQLMINGEAVGEAVPFVASSNASANPLSLSIPADSVLTQDGKYAVGYRVTVGENGVTEDSLTTLIRIDRTPPGAALLAHINFHDVSFGEFVKGEIPGYFNMTVGDLI